MFGSRGHYPARLKLSKPAQKIADFYLKSWYGGHLYHTPEQFPRLSSRFLFGNDRTMHFDIGCATAEYLISHAMERPENNFIGIDLSQKPVFHAVERCASMNLKNVRFFRADARLVLPLFEPESLSAVYLHFPIPILRRQQRKHLIFSEEYLDSLRRVLRVNGFLSFMTDSNEYYSLVTRMLTPDSWYAIETDPGVCSAVDPANKSYYHHLWQAQGKQALRFLLRKTAD